MAAPEEHERLNAHLLGLYGTDPFTAVREACETHRIEHGARLRGGEQECGVYPSDHLKMRVLSTIARSAGAKRILEIGAGLGYSGLWLADALPPGGQVDSIDRFPEHCRLAAGYAKSLGFAGRVSFVTGEATDVLDNLSGLYDLVHDDGWFAREPPYLDRMIALVRPGGLIVISNWFLLAHTITGDPTMDWSQFVGPDWAASVKAYAQRLAERDDLYLSFIMQPAWVALAYRK